MGKISGRILGDLHDFDLTRKNFWQKSQTTRQNGPEFLAIGRIMTSIKDTATVLEKINDKLKRYFNIQITEATKQQLYNACAAVVRDILLEKRNAFSHRRSLCIFLYNMDYNVMYV